MLRPSQVPDLAALLGRWRGKEAILVNAGWTDRAAVPGGSAAFVKSFETVYCFQPIALQVRRTCYLQPLHAGHAFSRYVHAGPCGFRVGPDISAYRPGTKTLDCYAPPVAQN